jgi:hypothetical protein
MLQVPEEGAIQEMSLRAWSTRRAMKPDSYTTKELLEAEHLRCSACPRFLNRNARN